MGMGSIDGHLERIARKETPEIKTKEFISEMGDKVPDTIRAGLLATYVSQGYVSDSTMRRYRQKYMPND